MKHRTLEHDFSKSPSSVIPRSVFDRSHSCKTTFDASYLIPVFVDEALPGDTFNMHLTAFARMSTPKFPIMDNLYMDSFFFAVPCRLLWDNWERFNGAQNDPDDSVDFTLPISTTPTPDGATLSSLHDYLGLPIGITGLNFNTLFHRAYQFIWNECFRDQNIQDSIDVPTGDGPDTFSKFVLLKRGKRHDYFTSALPWPQKGPSVEFLNKSAPVIGIGSKSIQRNDWQSNVSFHETVPRATSSGGSIDPQPYQHFIYGATGQTTNPFAFEGRLVNNAQECRPSIYADLTQADITINQLRQAFQIQKMFERDARGGTRYIEIIRSHFNVRSPDARLQRPEYLGGSTSHINVNPVAQTSAELKGTGIDETTPQGNLAAFATTTHTCGFVKSFTEHCVILGMVSVRADLTYQQGLNRMFSRSTRFDFYWPAFSHLGEQSVLNKEIYAQGTVDDDSVFGYQERYAEYRYKPSIITGQFRSTAANPLDAWHLSQKFANLPTLSPTFISENVPMDRILAVPSEPDFVFDSHFSLKCARPMPVYSVPGLVDHF